MARNGSGRRADDAAALWLAKTYQRRGLMLILAAYLLVGVFVLRMVVEAEEESVGLLFSIPIAMIALALGMRAGIATALLCLALMGVYDLTHEDDISVVGYLTRAVTFITLGGLVGAMTSTLDIAYQQAARRGEPRHSKDRQGAEKPPRPVR